MNELMPHEIHDMPPFDAGLHGLTDARLDPLFWHAELLGAPSAWWEHVAFAHWIVTATRPAVLVELGTHAGVSYAAFCQAVMRAELPTRCHAVDTWRGDEHAGAYDDTVFNELSRFNRENFNEFSTLIRSTFDEALAFIEDGSVDLLHIDGLHTYEAVRHDFDSWRVKLSDRAVVMFHDINERSGNFGVWKIWNELTAQYPSFTFLHGHGLGVLAVGGEVPDPVLALCRLSDPGQIARVRTRIARLGERWLFDTRERMLSARFGEVEGALQKAKLGLDADVAQLCRERDAAEQRAAADVAQLCRERDAAEQRAAADSERAAIAAARTAAARHALASLRKTLAESDATTRQLRAQLDAVTNSTIWRGSAMLRRTAGRLPPGLRRSIRGGVKLAYWTATLQLFAKLKERRRLLRRGAEVARQGVRSPAPGLQATQVHAKSPAIFAPPRGPLPVAAGAPARNRAGLRIVYISGEPDTPGHIYRVERPAAAARTLGADVQILTTGEIDEYLEYIAAADVLFIWRAPWSDGIQAAVGVARSAGAKIVFDVDDLMIEPNLARLDVIDGIRTQNLTEEMVGAHYTLMRQTMISADLCIASTEELAKFMRDAWMPTRVLPNGFDHEMLSRSRLAARRWKQVHDGLLRIGYAGGSRTHQRDFALCADAVAEALRAFPNARLVAFRSSTNAIVDLNEFPALRGLENQIEFREFVPLEQLPEEMARFDVNLAPLEVGNPFCECKSELKFFEAALVDVPTIASPTGPYRRAIRHEETGFLADSRDQWLSVLMRLLGDAALRKRIASAARSSGLWSFGQEQRVEAMADLLDLVRGARPAARAFERGVLRANAPATLQPASPHVPASEVLFDHDTLAASAVTIIVPLHNYAELVTDALDSAARQTLQPVDLIIVDDVSTDTSLDVALHWAKANALRFGRLRVVRNVVNVGLALTRNIAFALADTPWVLPLDADNRLGPKCAEECLRVARTSGAAYVYPIIQKFGLETDQFGELPYDPVRLSNGNYIDAMALISHAAWAVVGGYGHIDGGWEDFDLWCKFAEHGLHGERASEEPLAEYRVHGTSMIRKAIAAPDLMVKMIADLQHRHPWLTLVWPLPIPQPKKLPRSALNLGKNSGSRLATLLPILRCPKSGSRLSFSEDGSALVSETGLLWPLIEGRPNLFSGLTAPHSHPETHVSNPLPENARALTLAASGYVLHLSAGGSFERFSNVVEAEAAIFRHTDVLADAHHLPFADESFELVVAMNAFEHYRDPNRAAKEILRVLAPGGRVLIRTAFLQPEHEAPWHFYNCTRFGLEAWFEGFETEELRVSSNFHPGHSIAWLASECEAALRANRSAKAAETFSRTSLGEFVTLWRTAEDARASRKLQPWSDLAALPQDAQQKIAAGFEFVGRKPM